MVPIGNSPPSSEGVGLRANPFDLKTALLEKHAKPCCHRHSRKPEGPSDQSTTAGPVVDLTFGAPSKHPV